MTFRLIRDADLIRRAWKNGGGTTVEIAAFPSDADLDTFDWRLSMADVVADGAFSLFPEIDRTLVLIDGPGLILDMAGERHGLDEAAPILSFPGDVPVNSALPNGPVRDFNVMTRRGRASHRLRITSAEEAVVQGTTLALAHAGPVTVEADGTALTLGRFDSLLCEGPHRLRLSGPAVLVTITVPDSA